MYLVVFSQDNCNPCSELKLFLTNEEVEFKEVNLSKPDNKKFIDKYGIMSAPVTILFDEEDDEELARISGAKESDLEAILDLAEQL